MASPHDGGSIHTALVHAVDIYYVDVYPMGAKTRYGHDYMY